MLASKSHKPMYPWRNPFILAPMAGVTDLPFRRLCMQLGAGMVVTEMVTANPKCWGSRKSTQRLMHDAECKPKAVQIAGGDAEQLAIFARYNEDQGADVIDINMGCPAKKVCQKAAGSALLANEDLVAEILHAVVNAVRIPVTLKIRTGPDPARRNGVRIARIAEDAGIQAIAVHGRTRACAFGGWAEYATIADIKQAVNIPVIANGDIQSPQQAVAVMQKTGADAVMIGRAAQGRPWLFKACHHYAKTGLLLPEPPLAQIGEWLLAHISELHAFYGESQGCKIARKHVAWYAKAHPNQHQLRIQFNALNDAAAQLDFLRRFFVGA